MKVTHKGSASLCAFLDEDTDLGCSVEDVMVFFSGTNCIPPTGFPTTHRGDWLLL